MLQESVEKHQANKGSLIIMDPKTGAILTMCNAPTFDPNNYSEVENIDLFNNDAIYDAYEPGSVFKSFAMAAALDQGKITPNTTYDDTGVVEIGGFKIFNSDRKAHGIIDMKTALTFSYNTGSIYAVRQVGNEKWYEYVKNFGFGEDTGLPLSGESEGNIFRLAELRDIYSATSSFGQGLTVTPMQLITAFSAIANGGVLMKPYIVSEVIKPNGFTVQTSPQEVRRVISANTASTLSAMLVNAIEDGHGKKATVPGYYLGGKTGTAEIPRADGNGYDGSRHKDTFVGFGPVSDPKFVMLVKIDEPKDVMWAEDSAAPLWGQVADFLLEYYHIPPEREI
jgi:cell division protein FtsI (penicillin-binding protein 3)/stage V sporulation protein D (sporulation-specific penicillin-binding protein)